MTGERKRLTKVTGYVWCDVHGAIHDDCNDPYEDGTPCKSRDRRPVFVKALPSEGQF